MLSSLHPYHKDILTIPRLWILTALFCVSVFAAKAQNSEIGLELGGYNYLGDVGRDYGLTDFSLGGQFFIRKHVNEGISFRISAGGGSLKGADDEAFDVFSANRRASFEGNFVNADLLMEYHFLDYRNEKLEQYWTPYVFFGLGVYRFSGRDHLFNSYNTKANLRVPVGVGIKLRLDRRWVLGISASAYKTNTDLIDNVSAGTPNIKDYRGGNPNDDDWMFFTGISLSYTFYRIVCPYPFF